MKTEKKPTGKMKKAKDYILGQIMILVCTLSGWTETCDEDGNIAGIDAFWMAHGDDIATITYDGTSGAVTAITMTGAAVFVKWDFPEDVGFLNQPLAVNKGNQSIKQILNFTNFKFRQTLRNAIANMLACALCGDLVIIVRDNNIRYWLCGVKKTSTGFIIKGFKAVSSDGAKSGTNSESDSNEVVIQLEAKVGEFAREFSGDEGDIPTT